MHQASLSMVMSSASVQAQVKWLNSCRESLRIPSQAEYNGIITGLGLADIHLVLYCAVKQIEQKIVGILFLNLQDMGSLPYF